MMYKEGELRYEIKSVINSSRDERERIPAGGGVFFGVVSALLVFMTCIKS